MEIIRRKTDYGLRALALLAQSDRAMQVKELAAREQAPVAFLRKTFTHLARAGIVTGQRGPAGGFLLARPARSITVLEAVEVIQGPLAVRPCLISRAACAMEKDCGLRPAWVGVQENIISVLGALTIADLARSVPTKATRAHHRGNALGEASIALG